MSEPIEVLTCPVCESAARVHFMEKEGYTYSKCLSCGHVYSSLRPSEEKMAASLDEWGKCCHGEISRAEWELKPGFAKAAYGARAKLMEKFRLDNTLFDVGCSTGGFLLYMKQLGWDVSGVEASKDSADIARERGLNVHVGRLEDFDGGQGRKFDVVTMWDVIEHVPDPLKLLDMAGKMVRSEGALVILTPNSRSLSMRLGGQNCETANPALHLHLFSVSSLKIALEISGYKKAEIRSVDMNPFEIAAYIRDRNSARSYEDRKQGLDRLKKAADSGPLIPLMRTALNTVIGRTRLGDGLLAVAKKS